MLLDHRNYQNINQNQRFINNPETEQCVIDFPLRSDECLDLLIEKECEQFVDFFDYLNKLKNGNMDLVARQDAVNWITKVCFSSSKSSIEFFSICHFQLFFIK